MRFRPFLIIAAGLMGFFSARTQAAPGQDLAKLFPEEAEVRIQKGGIQQLPLPPEVVTQCRPDLSDLRLFDATGKEVPYFVGSGFQMPRKEATGEISAKVVNVKREEVRIAGKPSRFVETYEIEFPKIPEDIRSWSLRFETPKNDFVKQVKISEKGEDGSYNREWVSASVFRFSNSTENLNLPLRDKTERHLLVTLEGEEAYLEPALAYELSREAPPKAPEPLEITLKELSRQQEGGKTVLEFARPRGLIPDRLKIATSAPLFLRPVRVKDKGTGAAGETLGEATIFRREGEKVVENLEVGLRSAQGDRPRVEIENGDSPALEGLIVTAIVRQPVLFFSLALPSPLPPFADESEGKKYYNAGLLRFGGGRSPSPRYDLGGLSSLKGGGDEGAFDFSKTSLARLGEERSNPLFDNTSPLKFAMCPGALLDPRPYTQRRILTVENSGDGLNRLVLKAEDLAVLKADAADLRIVDNQSRQWPYFLQNEGEEDVVALKLDPVKTEKGESRYRLHAPFKNLNPREILVSADAPFFDRAYRLSAGPGTASEEVIARGSLTRKNGEKEDLKISLPSTPFETLELVVQDGNDTPLKIDAVQAKVTVPTMYWVAPGGTYTLLLGNAKETAPQYDLAQVKETVMAVNPAEAQAGPLQANPEFNDRPSIKTEEGQQQILLWGVLGAAVLLLTFLSLKMARSKPTGDSPESKS
ncbi:MAG: hypothetical protein U1F57_12330 [bacterium]